MRRLGLLIDDSINHLISLGDNNRMKLLAEAAHLTHRRVVTDFLDLLTIAAMPAAIIGQQWVIQS